MSERHANFLVNKGGATARDVPALIDRIRRQVTARTGLALECEVQFLHSSGSIKSI